MMYSDCIEIKFGKYKARVDSLAYTPGKTCNVYELIVYYSLLRKDIDNIYDKVHCMECKENLYSIKETLSHFIESCDVVTIDIHNGYKMNIDPKTKDAVIEEVPLDTSDKELELITAKKAKEDSDNNNNYLYELAILKLNDGIKEKCMNGEYSYKTKLNITNRIIDTLVANGFDVMKEEDTYTIEW